MSAHNVIAYLNKKAIQSKTTGGIINLDTLKPGDYFYLDVYDGLIGQVIEVSINVTVKWLNHPSKTTKAEWIAAATQVKKYNHE